jgi:acetyl esterase/lipase
VRHTPDPVTDWIDTLFIRYLQTVGMITKQRTLDLIRGHPKMKRMSVLLLLSMFGVASVYADDGVWHPSEGHPQIPIWPSTPPNSIPAEGPEFSRVKSEADDLVAGKPWLAVGNVTTPTMTVYKPSASNTGAVVVVFPGGGYRGLAIDLEGTEVCDALSSRGITCVLLKYRVPFSGPHWDDRCGCDVYPKVPTALQDAQRAIGLVRLHAAEWHIDPHKVGVMGFSAGGHIVANVSTHFDKRAYAPIDDADKESSRPDFAAPIYGGHFNVTAGSLKMMPDIGKSITAQTPPTFILFNANDPVDPIEASLSYFTGLAKAGVAVEMHSYATGGHGFGVRHTSDPVTDWVDTLFMPWLRTIGMISKT